MKTVRRLLRYIAFELGKGEGLYRRFCRPNGDDWAAYLKRRGVMHAIGDHCSIQTNTVITDPAYVSLGSNVRLSGCTLFGHDGSVNMLTRAYDCTVDRVGKIEVGDNVYIGHNAIVLPGVSIGSYALVAAGAVVNRDVPENSVVAGVPAKVVGRLDEYVERLKGKTRDLPWSFLLERRTHENYWDLEPDIRRLRLEHFFGKQAA
jgi:acetyltransferase-like isoleucine patch superfamily enzyme